MIDRREIDAIAQTLSVRPTEVERDYVNGWLLSGLSRSRLSDSLVLKGGNALRKAYFANTRYSKDLDFSSPGAVNRAFLRDEIGAICRFVTEKTGVRFIDERLAIEDKRRVSKDLEVLEVRAYFLDFYGEKQRLPLRIYMDVTQYERLWMPPVQRPLIHSYSDATECTGTVRCMALEEILASKLKCLLQRRHVADLFDYLRWVFFEDVSIDRAQVLWVFLRKTIYDRAPGAAFELLTNLPFAALQSVWEQYVNCPSSCRIGFAEGVQRFRQHLEELFGGQRHSGGYELEFLSSKHREPILSAGRSMHLMRLVYDGAARIIEPYAIRYKERRDGGGGEYFFAFNVSGGSSPPGIRAFLPSRMEALQELPQKFAPRYEIEVAKAGEIHDDVQFYGRVGRDGFVPGFGFTRGSAHDGPKHRVRCPQCGKLFARKAHNLRLKPHAHPRGGTCHGSWASHEGRW
ncbi:MAG: nucleotidyl transferase AbiEii/AbiGii toxin family protein [Deltaproteobacteria bacterium]|nr:nucleotidyl transferase AbiEii/AbiGii toxin family protein [Deltaproteobacteria bacterium]